MGESELYADLAFQSLFQTLNSFKWSNDPLLDHQLLTYLDYHLHRRRKKSLAKIFILG
jgi:hypothetical protein